MKHPKSTAAAILCAVAFLVLTVAVRSHMFIMHLTP